MGLEVGPGEPASLATDGMLHTGWPFWPSLSLPLSLQPALCSRPVQSPLLIPYLYIVASVCCLFG